MAQQGGDEGLTEKLGGMSLESVSGGTSKPPVGPAGLIHKVRALHTFRRVAVYISGLLFLRRQLCSSPWQL